MRVVKRTSVVTDFDGVSRVTYDWVKLPALTKVEAAKAFFKYLLETQSVDVGLTVEIFKIRQAVEDAIAADRFLVAEAIVGALPVPESLEPLRQSFFSILSAEGPIDNVWFPDSSDLKDAPSEVQQDFSLTGG